MKNIIIGGTVRSGKTTLANRIVSRFGYSKIESDTIVNAFDQVFPELGILHRTPKETRINFEPFLFEILNGLLRDLKYCENVSVFPGSQFLPANIDRYQKKDKYIVIFLGLNAPSPEALLAEIRNHDTENDWTHKKDDEWMLKSCAQLIKESEELKKQCEQYGFYYFNTFENREEVMNQILELIQTEQQ